MYTQAMNGIQTGALSVQGTKSAQSLWIVNVHNSVSAN
jgi:hypothetical protein